MKALLVVVVTLAAVYSGVWVLTVRGLGAGIDRAVAAAQDRGWDLEIESRETSGFPSRFDVTARDVSVVSPAGDLRWQAPVVQTAALSYRPNRLIAVLPPEQSLSIGAQDLTLRSQEMRASLHVAPSLDLGLETLTAEAAALDLISQSGWGLSTGPALAAIRRDGPETNAYDIYVSARAVRSDIAAVPALQAAEGTLTLDAETTFDRPLDRQTMTNPALLQTLRLRGLDLAWGEVGLRASGDLIVDATGLPEGLIDLEIVQWREVLALAEQAGWLPSGMTTTLSRGLGLLSGGQGTLQLPLVFADGRMALGPVPLGPAPRLR